ncbi:MULTISPECIES: O-antigen ligase family protein [unclassified Janthinobacterium]|uniref:O-antigen ligase family protein n=1 Tax=unclassified Janthinobacterium TaxID=2610881 RepID=UPI002712A0F0|nr:MULTISPECIES: O-antigen ligase family protein [unclassified Janthinobacterium]MDO8073026.1 O-antigen ligase family protein [Janthinobacterium sp. SUN176]MED5616585.1 O-antigen ligase family protein [Janthinobacterium sp. P210005]
MLGLTSVCVFLFSALALAVNSGYSFGALVLLLASSWLLWKRPRLHLQRRDYLLMGVMLAYFLIFTANMLYHADPARELDMPLRVLLALPVLLLLIAYPPRAAAWWSGLAIGAIAGAALAATQYIPSSPFRPQAATSNAIHYGNVSMLFGMLTLCGIEWAIKQRHRIAWSVLLLAGGLIGIFGSIISGSRGGWLALPVCGCIFVVHYARTRGKHYMTGLLAALLAVAVLSYIVPNSPVLERATDAVEDLKKFEDSDNVSTSVGQRLEMWRTALTLSNDHLWFGMGRNGYLEAKKKLSAEGKMSEIVLHYTNAHNDYIDSLVKRGIFGLLALLLLFLLPLTLFTRALRHGPASAQPFALAGVMLCTCYMIFGLTTSSLTLNIGIIMLVFPMVILWAMLRQQERIA